VLGPGPGNGTLYVGNDVGIFTCVTPGTLPEEETVDKCTLLLPKVAPPSGWSRNWVQDLVPIGELGGEQGLRIQHTCAGSTYYLRKCHLLHVAREDVQHKPPATSHIIPSRSLSFFIRVRACRIAGAGPLLFEVTFHHKEENNWKDVKYDVSTVFNS
jgi:hypothetical protein